MPTAELSPQANVYRSSLVGGVLEGGDGQNVYSWTLATHRSYWRSILRGYYLLISPSAEMSLPAIFCCSGLVRGVSEGGDGQNGYSWTRPTRRA